MEGMLQVYQGGGRRMLYSELKCREVINVNSGERYGNVCDLAFDACSGQVQAIVVPGGSKLFGLLKSREGMMIPFSKIKKLGEDVILVELP